MTVAEQGWTIRGLVISVRDLDRSIDFYTDVLKAQEVFRDAQVAVLEGRGSFRIYLRASYERSTHSGRQSLGARVISFDVGSSAELSRVEERLRAHGSFGSRRNLSMEVPFDVVFGNDPDRTALTFAASTDRASEEFVEYSSLQAIFGADV